MDLSSLLRFKANFLICKLVVRKRGIKIDGKVFLKIQGTVNYHVNQFKEIGKLALSTPHKRPFTIFSVSFSKGPGPKWRRLDCISQRAWPGRSTRLRSQAPSLPPGSWSHSFPQPAQFATFPTSASNRAAFWEM